LLTIVCSAAVLACLFVVDFLLLRSRPLGYLLLIPIGLVFAVLLGLIPAAVVNKGGLAPFSGTVAAICVLTFVEVPGVDSRVCLATDAGGFGAAAVPYP
jgi:hypothetical protein